jgi:hypothetical protein
MRALMLKNALVVVGLSALALALMKGLAPAQVGFQFKDPASPEFAALSPDASKTKAKSNAPAPGDVIIAGGVASNLKSTTAAEFFNPSQKKFIATGAMKAARVAPASTILGHTLFLAGGALETYKWQNLAKFLTITFGPLSSAESFNESSGKFSADSNLTVSRMGATATLFTAGPLAGEVLIVGGINSSGTVLSSAEIYNPTAGTFTAISAGLTVPRYLHVATLLADNTVLITGGLFNNQGETLSSAELFNPVINTFTSVGSMHDQRFGHTATLLTNNQVLIVGGYSAGVATSLSSAELYDPTTQTFIAVNPLTQQRAFHTATLLGNGDVLIAGGFTADALVASPPSSDGISLDGLYGFTARSAELYNPNSQSFSCIGGPGKQFADYIGFATCASTMVSPHAAHTATLLPTGSPLAGDVLIAGGFSSTAPHKFPPPSKAAEVFNPVTNKFSAVAAMKTARAFAASGLLQ